MIENYIKRFTKLRTAKNSYWPTITFNRAPHKPLLLLSVMDLFAEGILTSNLIELTPDLSEMFNTYWARIMPPGQRGNVAMPFFHLKGDCFWHLIPRPGQEAILDAGYRLESVNQLRDTVLGAQLDDELYSLLSVEESRNLLRTALIERYFAPEAQAPLVEQGSINFEAFRYSQALLEQARTRQVKEVIEEEQYNLAVRDQGFRRAVVIAYDRRCALCGIRVLTPDDHTVVDAAHIIPWSVGHNDDPRNGMALCRLCHWTFDEGLLSVSPQYVVIVSPQLTTNYNIPGHLLTLVGRGIIGPAERSLWPDLDALSWHCQNVFRKL